MRFNLNNPRTLATTAVMTALTLALTLIHLGQTATGGYIHLGDVAIFFSALAFGPWVGLVVGGLGTALADVLGGAAVFAPLSLVVHGLQGFLIGWIARAKTSQVRVALAALAGALTVIVGYWLGESLLAVWGGPANALLEVPWNLIQEAVGATGVTIYYAVAEAYPRIRQMA